MLLLTKIRLVLFLSLLFIWLVLLCREQDILFIISASGLFLKCRKFQPRYSYEIYSFNNKESKARSACFIREQSTG